MTKGVVARIHDMLETIEALERATAGRTLEDFQRDLAAQEGGGARCRDHLGSQPTPARGPQEPSSLS